MPANWDTDKLTVGGLASVEKFIGRLESLDEDVEGKYGLQIALYFEDCELIEAGDDVTLENGKFTTWVNQSNKQNSTNGYMLVAWQEFAAEHDPEIPPFGILLEWERQTYEFGDDMNPGRALVPVAVVE